MFAVDSNRVRQLILQSNMTFAAFAQKAGLNQLTIRRVLKDGAKATLKTIGRLAAVFGVDANELVLKS